MEQLFPSEIARLVLGYLKGECPEAAEILEAKSIHLSEYRLLRSQQKNPKTTVNGMTLSNLLDQHNAVASYIQNKLKEITRSQTISHSGDLIKNLETLIETIGGRNSDQNEVSVVYENIAQRQNNTETVKEIKLDSNVEQKPNCSIKNENIKMEKLTKDQEKQLNAEFKRTNYLTHTERRELAKEMGVSEMVIKLWFQNRRNEYRHAYSDRKRYRIRRDSGDSNDTVYEPRPSTSYSSNENEMNCSSSSQRERLRSSDAQKPKSDH